VPLAYLIVLVLIIALLIMLTDPEDAEADPTAETSVRVLLHRMQTRRAGQLCGYFGVVAGSFFALALWLPDYLSSQFDLPVDSGARLAQWFVIPGALAQVVGGALSDRFGSARVIGRALVVCLIALFVLSYPPMTLFIQGVDATIRVEFALPMPVEGVFVVTLGLAMGCTMGSLQRLVIIENRPVAAFVAGLLLVSACSVAFALPMVFSSVNHWLGIRSAVFMILFLLLVGCLFLFARENRRHEREHLLHPGI
ncbi:MAG: MFS transporter, partial [Marinobacter salsuginis]